jgi:hypothetical protein
VGLEASRAYPGKTASSDLPFAIGLATAAVLLRRGTENSKGLLGLIEESKKQRRKCEEKQLEARAGFWSLGFATEIAG